MREIKFRGHNGDKFVYGDLVHEACYGKDFIFIDNSTTGTRYSVDPATVGQFTGLHDDDGREIYEGDIIKVRTQNPYWRFRRNYVVEWGTDGWLLDGDSLYSWFSLHTLEVIGNVHDNPDLLEVEHD